MESSATKELSFRESSSCKRNGSKTTSVKMTPTLIGVTTVLLALFIFIFWQARNIQCIQQQCLGQVVKEHSYGVIRHTDVNGEDLMHVQAQDLDTVKKVCDLFDECAGFNSNGWLKSKVSIHVPGPADLYVKGEAQVNTHVAPFFYNQQSGSSSDDYGQMVKHMKVYVYETTIGIKHRTLRSGGYGVERMFFEQLLLSNFRTRKPEEATFFFIPIRCSAYILGMSLEEEGKREAQQYIGEMVAQIQAIYPYWQRSEGADHFYICAHDIGAEVGRDLLKNTIALVNTADYEDPYFVPHKDISLPPNPTHGPNSMPSIGRGGYGIEPSSRTILAFFAGDITSGRIRPTMWKHFANDPDFTIIDREVRGTIYTQYLRQSKFCLVPRGREVWSPRLMDAVFYGCIPVILSDHYHLPLQGVVDWNTFSVIVPEYQVFYLKGILQGLSDSYVRDMQKQLQNVYHHFVWNNPAQPHDAFYSVMYQLWQRRHIVRYHAR